MTDTSDKQTSSQYSNQPPIFRSRLEVALDIGYRLLIFFGGFYGVFVVFRALGPDPFAFGAFNFLLLVNLRDLYENRRLRKALTAMHVEYNKIHRLWLNLSAKAQAKNKSTEAAFGELVKQLVPQRQTRPNDDLSPDHKPKPKFAHLPQCAAPPSKKSESNE